MIARKTSKNQTTLPKAVADFFPGITYFDIRAEEGRIVLMPLRTGCADEVWSKLKALGICEADVADAIGWTRRKWAVGSPIPRLRQAGERRCTDPIEP